MAQLAAEEWAERAAWVRRAEAARGAERALLGMYARHGQAQPGRLCRDCVQCVRTGDNRRYWKCLRWGLTHGAGTDWRVSWRGCGLWEARARPAEDRPPPGGERP